MASNEDDLGNNTTNQGEVQGDSRADVTAAVEELLNTLSNKFAGVSSEIFAKMDDISRRLDNLEAAMVENKGKDGTPSKPQ